DLANLHCESDGQEARISWTLRQTYDAIEILEGCEQLALLPGDASEWRFTMPADGVYDIIVRTHRGSTTHDNPSCRVTIGPGRVLARHPNPARFAYDIARGTDGLFFVTEPAERLLRALDDSLVYVGDVVLSSSVVGDGEIVTGVTRGPEPETLIVYNNSRHELAWIDYGGEAIATAAAQLPILREPEEEGDEPYRGAVTSIVFDPEGDEGRGSVWAVEIADDVVHELDLSGRLIRSISHPYRDVGRDAFPEGAPFGASFRGAALVTGDGPRRLWLNGGTAADLGAIEIFQFDVDAQRILEETIVPVRPIRDVAGTTLLSFETRGDDDEDVLVVLPQESPRDILEVDVRPASLPSPTRLQARQRSLARDVEIVFARGEGYDAIRVERDCLPV
ncbi:MAG TPA: hypothetical protein VK116_03245, partial [Planctomycetota bacterium]|nr:hypothetical protein [Planctomycetota bacterium]